jgi:putative membrane protein
MRAHLIGTAIALAGFLAGCVQPYPGQYDRPYGSSPYGAGPYGSAYPDNGPPGYPDYGPNYGPPPYPDQGNGGPYQAQSNPPPYPPNYGQPPAANTPLYPNYGPPPAPGQANAPPTSLGNAPGYAGNPPPYGPPPAPNYQPYPNYGPPPNYGQQANPNYGAPRQQGQAYGPPDYVPAGPTPLTAGAYVMDSGETDRYEIDAAMIARSRAQSPAVRNFAEQMITAHTETTQDLMTAVTTAGMPAPPPARPDSRQQTMLDQLRRAPANTFASLYMGQQVTAHQEALALHRNYANRGDRPALRDFATRTWPKVQMHLDMAQNIRAQQRLY